MPQPVSIVWFRQDLRITDHPALAAAANNGRVLPCFILDDVNPPKHQQHGAASRVWLHHSLTALNQDLDDCLSCYAGDPVRVFAQLAERYDIQHVYWHRCYEPWRIQRDKAVKKFLQDLAIPVTSFNGSLLWEPWAIQKKDGTPYRVFTPFYRKGCLTAEPPRQPIPAPKALHCIKDPEHSQSITSLNLLPAQAWQQTLAESWQIDEAGAQARLTQFIQQGLPFYKEGRNVPAKPYISRLSSYLRWGQLSPNQIWYRIQAQGDTPDTQHFCSELGWREFSYHLLFHFPTLPTANLQAKFDAFPWQQQPAKLRAWQQGRTGIPIVDAGMRELWQTGFMHNRVRMIVGSFLVKNLLLDWRHGEHWFWDCLFDADLANNSASWQWVAGCGADAAPYFRIFNPVTQGQKFDPQGTYTRRYVPELKDVPDKYLFNPWEAPSLLLQEAGVLLGKHYPKPIVDLKTSREAALSAFASLKQGSAS
jgi:deoxyribodipyrimidine photo-lyase